MSTIDIRVININKTNKYLIGVYLKTKELLKSSYSSKIWDAIYT